MKDRDWEGLWGGRVWRFDELPSTNTWVMEHAASLNHGDVVWALSQTAGRGRLGRSWMAPPGRCLTLTVFLDHAGLAGLGPNLGQIAACAVADCLESHAIQAGLKWPNDVLVRGDKIAGLLVERDPERGFFALGMGLNVNVTAAELSAARLLRPATSMREVTGREFDCGTVLGELLARLERRLTDACDKGFGAVRQDWDARDWLKGKEVCLTAADRSIRGVCLGMGPDGRLVIRRDEGGEESFWTGDVERVRLTG